MCRVSEEDKRQIKKILDVLYTILEGQKKLHSEIVKKVEEIVGHVFAGFNDLELEEQRTIIEYVVNKYEEEVGIKTYAPTILVKEINSDSWLYSKKNIPHVYFSRYKNYLLREGFHKKIADDLERNCEKILSYCANPESMAEIDHKRGLVMGDVQSGKTASYLGLINMAYDYGYRIVVLLAGTTDYLRTQTQKRADEGVIGAQSDSIGNNIQYIGVGKPNSEHYVVPFTNQKFDFSKFIQNNLNVGIGDVNKPVLLVVKKVKSILESVAKRLQAALEENGLDSKSILIIDDEADNASVNVNKPDKDPTTINRTIRAIFNKFPIASYVGYTATPFANIFINPGDENVSNVDLFPSDFIVQLKAPSTYFGGRRVFPKDDDCLPRCLRLISEQEPYFLPVVHDKYAVMEAVPESLKEAISVFLINNVIRTIRGDEYKHRSMMVNITRFNNVQGQIREQIERYLETLTNEVEQLSSKCIIDFCKNEDMMKIYDLFENNSYFECIRNPEIGSNYKPIKWEDIQKGLYQEIKQFKVAEINRKTGALSRKSATGRNQKLDYDNFKEKGARIIAVGGLVLSRGLTLEGLMVSYYSRNAGAYDTLLQMCRWFGYRPRYEDLCRIYLSQHSIQCFNAVLDAVEDLKSQLNDMAQKGKSPKDFGLMVKEKPERIETTFLVTARNKMRNSETLECYLSYGGVACDTSKLSKDPQLNNQNIEAIKRLISIIEFKKEKHGNRYYAEKVSKETIAHFISELKIPYVNKKFDTISLSEYILESDVMDNWDIVIESGTSKTIKDFMGLEGCNGTKRSFHTNGDTDAYIRIGGNNNRVLDPSVFNFGLNLSEERTKTILKEKSQRDGKEYKQLSANDFLKERNNPIFVIYPVDLNTELTTAENTAFNNSSELLKDMKQKVKDRLGENKPLVAFAIGFPLKTSQVKLKYRANFVKIKNIVEGIEFDDEGAE